jgi:cytochrome c peroxidase
MTISKYWLALLAPAFCLIAQEDIRVPLGLLPIQWPADNPYSKAKADLGKLLYFDKRLSADGTVAARTATIRSSRLPMRARLHWG